MTGGEDGKTFSVPESRSPGFRLIENDIAERATDGRLVTYYIVFLGCLLLFLFLLRLVNSPFGRVLQKIHENESYCRFIFFRPASSASCAGAGRSAKEAQVRRLQRLNRRRQLLNCRIVELQCMKPGPAAPPFFDFC